MKDEFDQTNSIWKVRMKDGDISDYTQRYLPHSHAACDSCRLVFAQRSPHRHRRPRARRSQWNPPPLIPALASVVASAPSAQPRPHRPLRHPPCHHCHRVWVGLIYERPNARATECACRPTAVQWSKRSQQSGVRKYRHQYLIAGTKKVLFGCNEECMAND